MKPSRNESASGPLASLRSRWIGATVVFVCLLVTAAAIELPAQDLGPPMVLLGDAARPKSLDVERNKSTDSRIDTLVICPEPFQSVMQRWVEYRTKQDHRIQMVAPGRSAYEIREQVLASHREHEIRHVVLVGDAFDQHTPAQLQVPTDYVMARVNVKYGSEPEIATDNHYADVDGNGVPDLSIGRIPVDTADELESFIDRVIRYESKTPPCDGRRRINFVAGVGGFGQLIDNAIESTAKKIITDLMPGEIETSMTMGSWTSPYCPDPRCFSDSAIERFNEGCLFWVYIGHSAHHTLAPLRMPDGLHRTLDVENVDQIHCRSGSPIAIFLSCYTNAIDARSDGLAEMMLKQKNGPIATIGGTRVTMPAAMGVMSLEIMHEYFHGQADTLGEIVLLSKQRMIEGSENFSDYRQLIEGLATVLNPGSSFRKEKYEHAQLLHLLGDPLLRVPRPQPIEFRGPEKAQAGQTIRVAGNSPMSGNLKLELVYRRDRLRQRPPMRRKFEATDDALAAYQTAYDQARDLVCCESQQWVRGGQFSTSIKIPADVHGPCVVRAALQAADGYALGAFEIDINSNKSDSVEVLVAEPEKVADRIIDPEFNK